MQYILIVSYRFIAALGMGYLCSYCLAFNLTVLLNQYWPKAEAIYLAAFIALIFYVFYILMIFSIQNLKPLFAFSIGLLLLCSTPYWMLST